MITYEQQLDADPDWAMSEGSRHFEAGSAVQVALRKIARRLQEIGVPYAIAGGMALFEHGLRRFTEDVDLLVTGEGLRKIHDTLEGAGYRPPFEGSKNLRDAESGVRIEFLVAGQFPGDGKPKPVAFPEPGPVSVERDGIHFLNLPTLIELKLASGMTNPQRSKDLSDVQELIKLLRLPLDLGSQLNSYVQARYVEIWNASQDTPTRYLRLWKEGAKNLSVDGRTFTLQEMLEDGVRLESTLR